MLFNSLTFFIFFPIVTGLYFLTPHAKRWLILLIASCYFYMSAIPAYILILFFLILLDYSMALLIEKYHQHKKVYLILSVLGTCAVLTYFKYYNFFIENILTLAHHLHLSIPLTPLKIILPIGLSFHTFQSLSYVIEVYHGRVRAQKHLGHYALYVMFYPQLVAGPIERPQHFLPQLNKEFHFNYTRVISGLRLMTWGLFKKVVVAHKLNAYVSLTFDQPDPQITCYWLGVIFFSFMIYCDFSGYSDIARGAARIMGFDLSINFNQPLLAESVSDFWRRWHISLSTWFRDYIYIPLGGNKVSIEITIRNIFITFIISGLWHGAAWNFIIWGFCHALAIIIQYISTKASLTSFVPHHSRRIIFTLITFIFISLSWIFFRSPDLNSALQIFKLTLLGYGSNHITMGLGVFNLVNTIVLCLIFIIVEYIHSKVNINCIIQNTPGFFRWIIYYALVGQIIIYMFYSSSIQKPFIYFQF